MEKSGNQGQAAHQAVDPLALPAADEAQALRDISEALFAMRDALTHLSLALKDWQFEHDVARRGNAQGMAQGLLARLTAPPQ